MSSPKHSTTHTASLEPYHRKPKDSTSGTAKAGEEFLQVVIETPRGSRNKYGFDAEQHVFRLKSLPLLAWSFPGTSASSQARSGRRRSTRRPRPHGRTSFPSCVLLVRLLGAMQAEQTQVGRTLRNDRLITVAETSELFAGLQTLDDLPHKVLIEIDEFFTNYHRLLGKPSRTLGWKAPAATQRLINEARRQASS